MQRFMRDLTSVNNRSVRAKDTNVLRPFFVSGIEDQDKNSQLNAIVNNSVFDRACVRVLLRLDAYVFIQKGARNYV